jgi:hypothetical protein
MAERNSSTKATRRRSIEPARVQAPRRIINYSARGEVLANDRMAYRRPSRLASRMNRGLRLVCLMRPCAQRPNHCVLAAISSLPGAYNRSTPSASRLGTFGQTFRTESGPRQNSGWEVLPIWEN